MYTLSSVWFKYVLTLVWMWSLLLFYNDIFVLLGWLVVLYAGFPTEFILILLKAAQRYIYAMYDILALSSIYL